MKCAEIISAICVLMAGGPDLVGEKFQFPI